jgi:hypothetical protein
MPTGVAQAAGEDAARPGRQVQLDDAGAAFLHLEPRSPMLVSDPTPT